MNYHVEVALKTKNIGIWLSTESKERNLNSKVFIEVDEKEVFNYKDILKTLNFTEEEISILNSVNETRTFVESSTCYTLTREGLKLYNLAKEKFKKLIIKEIDEQLTPLEIALIEAGPHNIYDVTDILTPYVRVKYLTEFTFNPLENITNFIKIIKNHIDIIDSMYIYGDFYLGNDVFVSYDSNFRPNYGMTLNISKKKKFTNQTLLLNAIPLLELADNDITNNLKEDLFTQGLKPELMNEFNAMVNKNYVFFINEEVLKEQRILEEKAGKELLKGKSNPLTNEELKIILMPNTIVKSELKEIKDYHFVRANVYIDINDDWLEKANHITPKKITYIDLLHFLEVVTTY